MQRLTRQDATLATHLLACWKIGYKLLDKSLNVAYAGVAADETGREGVRIMSNVATARECEDCGSQDNVREYWNPGETSADAEIELCAACRDAAAYAWYANRDDCDEWVGRVYVGAY